MSTMKPPEPLLERLRNGQRFLITSHLNPDGDAIGSALGLARILRSLGKGAQVWMMDDLPKIFQGLPGSDRIHIGAEAPKGFPAGFDTGIALECPSLVRSGLHEHLTSLPLLNIDHHLGNEHYGEVNWVDTAAPSLGEMIFRTARALGVDLDAETATALFLTLVTDTGGFRFSNATSRAFSAAGALVDAGAQPAKVAEWLHENQTESALRLLSQSLATLSTNGHGVAIMWVTSDMFEIAGAGPGDTEGFIDYPRSLAGVEVVALIRQTGQDEYKVSLRSKGSIDVERIARSHGGGGHRNAAGFVLDGGLESVRAEVTRELTAAMNEQS